MSETLLIILGVTVFAMTLVAVLVFFYALFDNLAGIPDAPIGDAVPQVPGKGEA